MKELIKKFLKRSESTITRGSFALSFATQALIILVTVVLLGGALLVNDIITSKQSAITENNNPEISPAEQLALQRGATTTTQTKWDISPSDIASLKSFLLSELKGSGLVTNTIVERPTIVERAVERIVGGITQSDLDTQLNVINNKILAQVADLKNLIAARSDQNFSAIALTNKIDNLNGTHLYSVTAHGVSGLTDADIPDNITASNYMPLTGGTWQGSTIGVSYGGTGVTSYATGDILYASTTNPTVLEKLPIGTAGQVLKIVAGIPSWSTDLQGSGGAGAWATTTNNLALYPATPTNVVIVGSNATTSTGNIFELYGQSYFNGKVGIGTTSPYAKLSVVGEVVGNYFTATSTIATSTFPYLSSTQSNLGTVVGGTWQGTVVSPTYGGTGWGNLQANTILLGNGNGAIATTSAGTNGQILVLAGGVPTWQSTTTASASQFGFLSASDWTLFNNKVASSSLSAYVIASFASSTFPTFTYASTSFVSLPYASSTYLNLADWYATTTSDIAEGANLYWTNNRFDNRLSATTTLPNLTTLLGLTNATTSLLTVSTLASTTNLIVSATTTTLGLNVTGTATSTFANGLNLSAGCFSVNGTCITSGTGSGSAFAWTPTTNYGVNVNSTSTPIWFSQGLMASTTSYFVNASTSLLTVSGRAYFNSSTTFNGVEYLYPSADGSSGQFLRTNGAGGLTWATVSGGSGAAYDWQKELNFGVLTLTPTTTIPIWAKSAIYASSTLTIDGLASFQRATSTQLTVTGQAYFNSTTTFNGVPYLFPNADGTTAGQVLSTNSAGQLSWATVGGGGITPSFKAKRNGPMDIPASTWTPIVWEATDFDTNNNFSTGTSTSYFKPSVAGKYLLTATLRPIALTAGKVVMTAILKNGAYIAIGSAAGADGSWDVSHASVVIDANGTTDYFTVQIYQNDTATKSLDPTSYWDHFTGSRLDGGSNWTDNGATTYLATGDNAAVGTSTAYSKLTVWATSSVPSVFSAIDTASTTLFTIMNGGNVGIGTTSPYAKLSVTGQVVANYFSATSTNATSTFAGGGVFGYNGSALSNFGETLDVLGSFAVENPAGTDNFIVGANGNVGVSSSTPWARLSVHALSTDTDQLSPLFAISSTTPAGTASTTFIVTRGGNVGVGTSTPAEKLSTSGRLYVGGTGTSTVENNLAVLGALKIGAGSLYLDSTSIRNLTGNLTIQPSGLAILANATATQLTTTNNTYLATASGNVGIRTTSPGAVLDVGGGGGQSGALISARMSAAAGNQGNSIEWGHNNGNGYGSVLGQQTGGGTPFICFTCEAGTNANTFRTRGSAGSLLQGLGGTFYFSQVPTATADNQTATILATLNSTGLGIGVAPSYKLDVSGNAHISSGVYTDEWFRSSSQQGWYNSTYAVGVYATQAGRVDLYNGAGLYVPGATTLNGTLAMPNTALGGGAAYLCLSSGGTVVTYSGTCGASSIRFKENVAGLNYGLSDALKLNPVSFNYKPGMGMSTSTKIGFIAEDMLKVIPEVVQIGTDGLPEAITYDNLTAVLTKALQETVSVLDIRNAATSSQTLLSYYSGTTTPAIYVDALGNIGIGTTTPNYKLTVDGEAAAKGFVNISTKEAKKDIVYLNASDEDSALEKIKQTNLATYNYNSDIATTSIRMGLIAEEAPKEVLSVDGKGVDLYKMTSFAWLGLKAQEKKIDNLELRLSELEKQWQYARGATSTNTLPDAWSNNGGVLAAITSTFQNIGITLADGLIKTRQFLAEKITAKKVVAEVLEMKDSTTGDTYCLRINNGEWSKVRGVCEDVSPQPMINSSLATTTAPIDTAAATTTDIAVLPAATDQFNATTTLINVVPTAISPIDTIATTTAIAI